MSISNPTANTRSSDDEYYDSDSEKDRESFCSASAEKQLKDLSAVESLCALGILLDSINVVSCHPEIWERQGQNGKTCENLEELHPVGVIDTTRNIRKSEMPLICYICYIAGHISQEYLHMCKNHLHECIELFKGTFDRIPSDQKGYLR